MQFISRWFKPGAVLAAVALLAAAGPAPLQAQGKPAAKPAKAQAGKPAAKKPVAKKPAPARPAAAATGAAAAGVAAGAAAAVAAAPARSGPIELQVWHAMGPEQGQEFEALVERFNAQQPGFTVKTRAAASSDELTRDGMAAVAAKRAPHLIQISDTHSPEFIARQGAIMPMHELLAKYPIQDLRWFLPQSTSAMRDARGRLLALPWMAQAPIYLYNRDLYRQAGLDPDAPPKTWRQMQTHLIALQQSGVSCPYATSWQTWIHVENLSAMHDVAYATRNNGLEGTAGAQLLANNLLHVRHLALMMSWVRSHLFTVRSQGDQADAQFANGECAVLTSGTGALAKVQAQSRFSYGVAPLPYYDEEATRPGKPFVGGSSLWALGGHPAAEQKALAQFIAYLATPVVAAEWHQKTGFLPLTEAAWRTSTVSYYKSIPGAEAVVRAMEAAPSRNTRGFRLHNYAQVSGILDEELDSVWNGSKPPKQGLDDAVRRASVAMRGAK